MKRWRPQLCQLCDWDGISLNDGNVHTSLKGARKPRYVYIIEIKLNRFPQYALGLYPQNVAESYIGSTTLEHLSPVGSRKPLRPYMGYSRESGPEECAVLVFAHNAHEARILTYRDGLMETDYLDTAAKAMSPDPWIMKQKLRESPHVIESPDGCRECGQWGMELFDGVCGPCCDEMEQSNADD